jgi:hypothetical protein
MHTTIDRVKTILEEGSYEQIKAIKNKSQMGEGPKIRTLYVHVSKKPLKCRHVGDRVSPTNKGGFSRNLFQLHLRIPGC